MGGWLIFLFCCLPRGETPRKKEPSLFSKSKRNTELLSAMKGMANEYKSAVIKTRKA